MIHLFYKLRVKLKGSYFIPIPFELTLYVCMYVLTSRAFHTSRGDYSSDQNHGGVTNKLIMRVRFETLSSSRSQKKSVTYLQAPQTSCYVHTVGIGERR